MKKIFDFWLKKERLWIAILLLGLIPIGMTVLDFVRASELKALYKEAKGLAQDKHYDSAIVVSKKALQLAEQSSKPGSISVARAMNKLGEIYLMQGQYAEAEPLIRQALEIRKQKLEPDHLDLADSLQNLDRLNELMQIDRDLVVTSAALKEAEKTKSPDYQKLVTILNKLGELYSNQEHYSQAESFLRRALVIQEKSPNPDYSTVVTSLENLGGVYAGQQLYDQANPFFRRALAIQSKTHHSVDPQLAGRLFTLCNRNELMCKKFLAINESSYGPDDPKLVSSLRDLALLYEINGQYPEAESYYKRILAILEKAHGPDHLDVSMGLSDLALLYDIHDKYAQAEPLYKRALAIQEKALGPDHLDVATSLENLARIYQKTARTGVADKLFKRAEAIHQKSKNG